MKEFYIFNIEKQLEAVRLRRLYFQNLAILHDVDQEHSPLIAEIRRMTQLEHEILTDDE